MEFALGLHSTYIALHPYISPIFVLVGIFVLYLGMKDHKTRHGGEVEYLPSFLSGVYISIVFTILSPLVSYVFHTFINPDFFDSMINAAVLNGFMIEEKAKDYFSLRSYIQQGIVGSFIFGIVTSAIIALFLRKRAKYSPSFY